MLASLFASRRELKRLAASVLRKRERIVELENENKYLRNLVLERDLLFVDRYQTAVMKTYAISDEAEHKASLRDVKAMQAEANTLEAEYLLTKRQELERDAIEAGMTTKDADALYRKNETVYIETFREINGF